MNYLNLISALSAARRLVSLRQIMGVVVLMSGWFILFFLDGRIEIGTLAMLLVLTSALMALCFSLTTTLLLGIACVLAFDWFFIPPRGNFHVELSQHLVMLLVIFAINIIVASIMSILRAETERARMHAREADMLRDWSDKLQQTNQPQDYLQDLCDAIARITQHQVAALMLNGELPAQDNSDACIIIGDAGIEQRHALWFSTRHAQQLGRGTGQYELFSDVYLPMRAKAHAIGAVLIKDFAAHEWSTRIHLQTLCDQFASAVERYRLLQQEMNAREAAQVQLLRTNILAAISHDYRTPLATIMGAASSLIDQAQKFEAAQKQALAQRIFDEAERLRILTANILQLARLDAGAELQCDWQSVEEILADMRRRWRTYVDCQRLRIDFDPTAPLIWCDVILITQLLDNLLDNAFKYSPASSPVYVQAHRIDHRFVFSVIDQGAGVADEWREKIFAPFQRAPKENHSPPVAGAGVGLALCRAIALAHGGELVLHSPVAGGAEFVLYLPLRSLPEDF